MLKTILAGEAGAAAVNNGQIAPPIIQYGLSLMCAALTACAAVQWRDSQPERNLALLALVATAAQLLVGGLGWLYRYEAWLIALDGFAIAMSISRLHAERRGLAIASLAVVVLILTPRAAAALFSTSRAPQDRVWEHFGPLEVVESAGWPAVLANDVGVLAYYGSGRTIDIYGLADNRVLRLKREDQLDSFALARLAKAEHARVAVAQLCWDEVRSRVPAGWELAEIWRGPRNVVFGDTIVAFLAADPAAAASLTSAIDRSSAATNVIRYRHDSAAVRAFNEGSDKNAAAFTFCEANR